jgi:hypothetical protein
VRNSTARVFAPDWVRLVQGKYPSIPRYTTPFIVRLALEPALSNERKKIEQWFEALPECVKLDIQQRLRSEDSHQHYGAYYELVMHAFLKKMGYSVDIHPELEEGKPDLLISGNNLGKPLFVEVATVFDDPMWQKEQQKLHRMMEQLYQIEHYFFVHVSVLSDRIPKIVDYKALNGFVAQWLDSFDPEATHEFHEIRYQAGGLNLKLMLIPQKVPRKVHILGGWTPPARFIGGTQLRRVLQAKIKKYKSVKRRELPFVIALSFIDAPLDDDSIISELIGKVQLTITRTPAGKQVSKVGIDRSGLVIPKLGFGGKAQNTRLSAVINIESTWLKHKGQAIRKHSLRVIHNRWATIPLSAEFLRGYPQFVCSSQSDAFMTFSWVDKDSAMSFDC